MREIETQAFQAQQQIAVARSQVANKQREMRLAQLTQKELASLPADTPVYQGVGKMCAPPPSPQPSLSTWACLTIGRFVAEPVSSLSDTLGKQIKDLENDVDGLGKRLHYLETTAKNSQEHIAQMLRRAGES